MLFSLVLTGVLLLLLFFILVVYLWLKPYFSPIRHIPEPKAWPILGHSPLLSFQPDSVGLHEKWAKEFQDEEMYQIRNVLYGVNPVFLLRPEWCKYILSRPGDFVRNDFFSKFIPTAGNGLLVAHGEHHRFQKRILSKAFTSDYLKKYVGVFDQHAKVLCEVWDEIIATKNSHHNRSTNIDVREFTSNFSFDIIAEVGFGFKVKSQVTKKGNPLVKAFMDQLDCLISPRRIVETFLPFLRKLSLGIGNIVEKDTKVVLDEVLRNRKEKIESDDLTETEKNDLLSVMIGEKDEKTGQMLTDQLIKDSTVTFLFAGFETTASAIPIVLLHLAQRQEMQERARTEILERLNGKTGELNSEDLDAVPYTFAFIKESLRFTPPLPVNARVATKDCTFGKYKIPKGTNLTFFASIPNRDPEKFDYPDEFIPERYMEGSSIKFGQSLTFGFGPYNCIGKKFAEQEILVVIMRLLQNYKFTLDSKTINYMRKFLVALRFTPSIILRVEKL